MGDRYVPVEGKEGTKGDNFLSFLTKLEWIKNAEVENARPFTVETLRTNHYFYISTRGMAMGSFLHSLSVLLMFLTVILVWVHDLFTLLGYLTELYLVAIKVLFPLWFVRKFVVYEHGLTTEIVKVYLVGFAFVSFIFDLLSLMFTFFVILGSDILYGIGQGGVYSFYDETLYPLLKEFFNFKTMVMWGINMVIDLLGLIYFYWHKKRRKFTLPVWTPLDEMPIERDE